MSRFGDTASNTGMLMLLDSYDYSREFPLWIKTLCASFGAAGFRILLMPIDTTKTVFSNFLRKDNASRRKGRFTNFI
jgi:hypothetical protein